MADLRYQNKAACPKRSEMVVGCFGLGVDSGWLTVLRVEGGLVGWTKVEGDYSCSPP